MKIMYILNDDYVERCIKYVDKHIYKNVKQSQNNGLKRPRVFFIEDEEKDYVKCYSLTSKKAHISMCKSYGDGVINLPTACFFPIANEGCIVLSSPLYVPKEYVLIINPDIIPHEKWLQRIYQRYRFQLDVINKNKSKIKEAINILWNEGTRNNKIKVAQSHCIDLTKAFAYCQKENEILYKDNQIKTIEKSLTKIYDALDTAADELDSLNNSETEVVTALRNAQGQVNIAVSELASCSGVDIKNKKQEEILDEIEQKLLQTKSSQKSLKQKQGIK